MPTNMYSLTDGGLDLRTSLKLSLALWHPGTARCDQTDQLFLKLQHWPHQEPRQKNQPGFPLASASLQVQIPQRPLCCLCFCLYIRELIALWFLGAFKHRVMFLLIETVIIFNSACINFIYI